MQSKDINGSVIGRMEKGELSARPWLLIPTSKPKLLKVNPSLLRLIEVRHAAAVSNVT
jgi:hypothetical protein